MSVGAVGGAENAKRLRRGQIFEGGFDFADAKRMSKMNKAVDRTKEVFQPEHKALIQVSGDEDCCNLCTTGNTTASKAST